MFNAICWFVKSYYLSQVALTWALLPYWAEFVMFGFMLGLCYQAVYDERDRVGWSAVLVFTIFHLPLVGFKVPAIILLSVVAHNRLMHALNGNIVSARYGWIIALLVVGVFFFLVDFTTGFKVGFFRNSKPVAVNSWQFTVAFVTRAFVWFGVFGLPLCALALLVSPVVFVGMVIMNMVTLYKLYRLQASIDKPISLPPVRIQSTTTVPGPTFEESRAAAHAALEAAALAEYRAEMEARDGDLKKHIAALPETGNPAITFPAEYKLQAGGESLGEGWKCTRASDKAVVEKAYADERPFEGYGGLWFYKP